MPSLASPGLTLLYIILNLDLKVSEWAKLCIITTFCIKTPLSTGDYDAKPMGNTGSEGVGGSVLVDGVGSCIRVLLVFY